MMSQRLARRLLLPPVDLLLWLGERWPRQFQWLLAATPPTLLEKLGTWRAVRAAERAVRRVPAYRRFVEEHAVTSADVAALRLPYTDKSAYVDRYGLVERCVDGRLPRSGIAIDESSGSTGRPYNWIRSSKERETSEALVSNFARYLYGDGTLVTINAFSMGAWATGTSMGVAMQRRGVVKNTGPDVDKILATLEFLGPGYRYLICGYPPFLKHVLDVARERAFPLERYRIAAAVGGEGMSEALRDYLSAFDPVYSGYGATDVEIGLAGETPLSVAVRRAAWADAAVRCALFGADARLPMLFQYNPLSHHVAVTDDGELVFTINRLNVLSPRVAYNIHDEGGVATYAQVRDRLAAAGLDIAALAPPATRSLPLPFLWVYGRRDSTVSVMGANIYPEDVEQALYALPDLAAVTNSFCLGLEEQPSGAVRPCFSFEVRVPVSVALESEFEREVIPRVTSINADLRVALGEHRDSVLPVVRLYELGEGPFRHDNGRIKQTRIASELAS